MKLLLREHILEKVSLFSSPVFSFLSIFTGEEEAVTVVRGSDRSRDNLGRSRQV